MSRRYRSQRLHRGALAAVLVGASQAASAAAVQSLTLNFDASSAVPIGPWTSVAIAVMVAACGLAFLRRKGGSPFAQWCLIIATGGVLAVIPPIPEADAIEATPLITSPEILSPLSCPFVVNPILFQNATGRATVIRSVAITGTGPCSLSGPPAVPAPVQGVVSSPECTAGLALAPSDFCVVTVSGLAP